MDNIPDNIKSSLSAKIMMDDGEPVFPKTEESRIKIEQGMEKGYSDYYNGVECPTIHPRNVYEIGYEAGWLLAKEMDNKQ